MKKKLSLFILMAVMCLTVLAGCGTDNNNNGNNGGNTNNSTNQGLQEPSTNNNATDSTTDDANVTGNDGSNTNNSGTNGTGNEGSVTGTNGSSEGVIDEIATDIGNGLEDLGSDMTGADNSNVNDVTSGRQ